MLPCADRFLEWHVTHIYHRIFDEFSILDATNTSRADEFAKIVRWLEFPGCLFQRNDLVLDSEIRSEGVIKPGLYVSVVLKGAGMGGPLNGVERTRYSDNSIVVMGLRTPSHCGGQAARGTYMFAAGLAFPYSSIERLGLQREFLDLFAQAGSDQFAISLKAPARILAMATEMLTPTVRGRVEELLLSAHALEILVRVISMAGARAIADPVGDIKRRRLRAVRDAIDADLRRSWTIPQLAREAGISRRSFNTHFRRVFGMSAADYLRTRRLEAAKDAIIEQGVSINEAAYLAGYGNPANFATAFRKHFGQAPSRIRALKH